MFARVTTVAFEGIEARGVDVQVQIGPGMPAFTIVGLPDKAVAESRERVRGALNAIGLALPPKRVSVSFAGTPQDVQRALDTWSLDQFSFTIRPFNPSPSKPGDRLDELLTADNVGSMRAVTYPSADDLLPFLSPLIS